MITASARWAELSADVSGLLSRAEKYAKLTIPALFPEESHKTNHAELQYDWQGLGARGVNNLANKLMLTMFPPGRPFFRLEITDSKLAQDVKLAAKEAEVAETLAVAERKGIRAFEAVPGSRATLLQTLKQLITTGNGALEFGQDSLIAHTLRSYRVRRNMSGEPVEILICQETTRGALVPALLPYCTSASDNTKVRLFRWYTKVGKRWDLVQYLDETKLPQKFDGRYSERTMPLKVLVWELQPGEDYGIGHVEQNVGDLAILSTLSQAEVDMALQAAQFRWLANPAGQTRVEDFETSENGACLPGSKEDLSIVSASRAAELAQVAQSIGARAQNISQAFLLNTSMTRQAERVTAEEIRMQMQELETALGGTYSRLGQDLQYSVARWAVDLVDEELRKAKLAPVIITGLDGLSRNMEADQLRGFLRDVSGIVAMPPEILGRLRVENIVAKLAAGWGLSAKDYVVPDEEYQAAQQQQYNQQLALAQAGTPADPSAQPAQPQG